MKISATIITFNEEAKIADAIRSVDWADEVLVVDSFSTDRTVEIAESLGAKAVAREWPGFAPQKQFAVDEAANDWILSLDADELVSPELRARIEQIKDEGPKADGFRIPRLSVYMGRRIRHSGWYPDKQLRLFDRRRGRWNDVLIHESFRMDDDAKVADLSGEILHYSVDGAAHHHRMIGERYAPLAAEQMFAEGKPASAAKIMTAATAAFLRSYILKAGFLDGLPGYVIARFAAHNAFLKHLLLWERQHDREDQR